MAATKTSTTGNRRQFMNWMNNLVEHAQNALWDPNTRASALMLEELRDVHGLADETIEKHRLGLLTRAFRVRPEAIGLPPRRAGDMIEIPPGIVAPVMEGFDVIGVIIKKNGMCHFIRGSAPRPLDIAVTANKPTIVTADPLLAIRFAQSFGDTVGVRALGVVRAPRDSDFHDLSCVPKLVVAAANPTEAKALSSWPEQFPFSSPILLEWERGEGGVTFEDRVDEALNQPRDAAPAATTVPELATRRMVDLGCGMQFHARQRFVSDRELDEDTSAAPPEPEDLRAGGVSGDVDNPRFCAIEDDGIAHTIDTRACSSFTHEYLHAHDGPIVPERMDGKPSCQLSLEAMASLAAGQDLDYNDVLERFLPFDMTRTDRDLLASDEACPELAAYRAVLNGHLLRSLLDVLDETGKLNLLRLALSLEYVYPFDYRSWTLPLDRISSMTASPTELLVHVSLSKKVSVQDWCARADGTHTVVSPLGRTVRVRRGTARNSHDAMGRTARTAAMQDFRMAVVAHLRQESWMSDGDESGFERWAHRCLGGNIGHDAPYMGGSALKVVGRTPRGLLLHAPKGSKNSAKLLILRAAWESLRMMLPEDFDLPVVNVTARTSYAPHGKVKA